MVTTTADVLVVHCSAGDAHMELAELSSSTHGTQQDDIPGEAAVDEHCSNNGIIVVTLSRTPPARGRARHGRGMMILSQAIHGYAIMVSECHRNRNRRRPLAPADSYGGVKGRRQL